MNRSIAALLLCLFAQPSKGAVEVGKWKRFEVSLGNTSWEGNPFDVSLKGAFKSPSGRTLVQWGFYAGQDRWRIFFMPDELGKWTFETVSPDPKLDGKRGAFVCVPSKLPGSLVPNGKQWVLRDGEVDLPIIWNPTVPTGEHWGFREKGASDPVVRSAIDFAHDVVGARLLGFYELLIVPTGWAASWPQEAVPYVKGKEGETFHQGFWDALNRKLDLARDRGMGAYVMLYSDDELTPDRFGLTPRSEKELRFFRYVVARIACYPVVLWDSGIDISEYRDKGWVDWFAEWFMANDPWQHPVGSRSGGGSGNDVPRSATYLSTGGANLPTRSELLAFRDKGLPVAHTDHWRPFISRGNWTHDKIRTACWRCALSGAQALYLDYNQGPVQQDEVLIGAQYIGWAAYFFQEKIRHGLGELIPHDELIIRGEGAILAAHPGVEYVLYDEDGGDVEIDLSHAKGPLQAAWYNPRTGQVEGPEVPGGENASFLSPTRGPEDDWVLHVHASSPKCEP